MTAHVHNVLCTSSRCYIAGEENPSGWDKFRDTIEAMTDEELEICGLRRTEHGRAAAFKGVVWNHGPREVNGEMLHRYVVVGAIVTNKPIAELERDPSRDVPSETILCGECPGLLEALASVQRGQVDRRFGDAGDVLLRLGEIRPLEDV